MGSRSRVFSLRRKFGIVFSLLALMLLGVCAVTIVEIDQIRANVQRVFEENREAELTRSLLLDVQGVRRGYSLIVASRDRDPKASLDIVRLDQVGHIAAARETLRELLAGPAGHDPSEEEHEEAERRIYDEFEDALDAIHQRVDEGTADSDLGDHINHALHLAEILSRETHSEAREAGEELETRQRELLQVVVVSTPLAIVVLLLVSWFVARHIIRPIRRLEEGARSIGGGELGHRITVTSRDEIGVLSREVNRMAERLQEHHGALESQVRDRTRQLIRADQLAGLGTLAAGVAHEINNPLASIASCAEGLLRRHRNGTIAADELVEYLEIIAKEAYRASGIAERLLEFARQDAGEIELISVETGIREAGLMLEHRLAEHSIRLEQDVEADLPLVSCNAMEWKQVVLNLLHNAIEASPDGTVIRAQCRHVGDSVEVRVTDEGGGIADEHLGQVFDPFFTTKDPGSGTGIGLSIVHSIVDRHGGQIEVSNESGGACFRVRFPAAHEARL